MAMMPEAPVEVPVELGPKASERIFSRGRILLIVALFVVELAVFVVGLLTPLDSSTQQTIANQTSSQFDFVKTATAGQLVFFIFIHNLGIALVEMVPVFGAFFFLLSIYTTGLATQALVEAQGLPGSTGLVLFALPYSFVEFLGYAIAVGSGTMLLVAWRRKRLAKEARVFVLEVGLVALVLVVAAIMETATTYSTLVGLGLWVPAGLALAWGIVRWTRKPR